MARYLYSRTSQVAGFHAAQGGLSFARCFERLVLQDLINGACRFTALHAVLESMWFVLMAESSIEHHRQALGGDGLPRGDQSGPEPLTLCDREAIRTPAGIQPHGFLLVLDDSSHRVVQMSDNAPGLLGIDNLIGEPLSSVVPEEARPLLEQALRGTGLDDLPAQICTVEAGPAAALAWYSLIAHRHAGMLILEFEEAASHNDFNFQTVYSLAQGFVRRLQEADSIDALMSITAAEVRRLTGFNRALIYRFDEEANGLVVGESGNGVLPSYLGRWFPASDIPRQARQLYEVNRLRLVPDAAYTPVPISPALSPRTGTPLDMTHCVLRSVSPVHRAYMRNMGTAASMSVSVMRAGRLWGLISCHHSTPHHVPHEVRSACDFLAQVFALQLEAREQQEDFELRVRSKDFHAAILSSMNREESVIRGIEQAEHPLLNLVCGDGAALVIGEEVRLFGDAPTTRDVSAIAQWFAAEIRRDVHATESLPDSLRSRLERPDAACGVLAVSLSPLRRSALLWFRQETVQQIMWAGRPAAHDAEGMSRTFEPWTDTVHGRARAWKPAEKAAAAGLRTVLMASMLRDAEELAALQRRAANEALRVSEQRLRLAVDASPILLLTTDAELRCTWIGKGHAQLAPSRVLGRRLDDIVEPARVAELTALMRRVLETAKPERAIVTLRLDPAQPQEHFDVSVEPLLAEAEEGLAIAAVDITERVRSAEALQESERLFRSMAESSPGFVWTTDANGVVNYLNGTWQRFTGRGAPFHESRDESIHPDDRDEAERVFWQALSRREPFRAHYRLRRADGEYRWVLDQGAPRTTAGGELLGYVGSGLDVTDQEEARETLARSREELELSVRERTAALERTHEQLRLSERMASLGTLSAGLGHDMGNLLLPVRLRLDALRSSPLPDEIREDIDAIASCAEYLQRLAAGLRLFTLDPADNEASEGVTRVDHWWAEVQTFLKNALPAGVSLSADFSKATPVLGVPRHQLTQAIFNLVQNAGDAMRARGRGAVQLRLAPAGAGWAELCVIDNGPGMSEDVRLRCLEPFFSTKTRKLSTGLGLALVQGVIKSVKGQIAVQSAPGQGTRFTLSLPTPATLTPTTAPGLAVVSVQDPRRSAFIVSVLNGAGMATRPIAGEQVPRDADLWVADDASGGILEFLESGPRHVAVLFSSRRDVPTHPRLRAVDSSALATTIRRELEEALSLLKHA